jgi:Spy/CpxP family protein refolding chaperone
MKKTKLMIVALTATFLAAGFIYAQAQDPEDKPFRQRQGQMFTELGLTQKQQEKLAENRKAQRQELSGLMEAIREKQEKLQSELKDPKATRAKLQPLIAEIKSLQARLIDQRINGIFAVKEILTPEQFIKFQEKIQKMHKGKKGRFQERQKSGIGRRCYQG